MRQDVCHFLVKCPAVVACRLHKATRLKHWRALENQFALTKDVLKGCIVKYFAVSSDIHSIDHYFWEPQSSSQGSSIKHEWWMSNYYRWSNFQKKQPIWEPSNSWSNAQQIKNLRWCQRVAQPKKLSESLYDQRTPESQRVWNIAESQEQKSKCLTQSEKQNIRQFKLTRLMK